MECLIGIAVMIGIIILVSIKNASSKSSGRSGYKERASSRSSQNRNKQEERGGKTTSSFVVDLSSRPSGQSSTSNLKQSRDAWKAPSASVTVAGRKLQGMVYVGSSLMALSGYNASDPALINPGLNARSNTPDIQGDHLDYWPSYAQIPPASRSAYLDWLAGGRRDPDYAIGYVFLFFYGIERRILFDAKEDPVAKSEMGDLIDELESLLSAYGDKSGSFRGYCDGLIEYARCAYGYEAGTDTPLYPNEEGRRYHLSGTEKRTLSRFLKEGEPIPATWALAWLHGTPDHRLRTAGNRCRDAFDDLFVLRYNEQFEEGLIITASPSSFTVTYRPASGGIRGTASTVIQDEVDFSSVRFPPKLRNLANTVENELDAYSRWIGRREDRTSVAALGQLPTELVRDRADANAQAFVNQIKSWMGSDQQAVIESQTLVDLWPSKNRDYLTKTEAEALSGFLAGFGYGVEPDVRYSRNPSKRDFLTLFKLSDGDEEPGEDFHSARLLLHLASAVAAADDHIDQAEEEHIEQHLEQSLDLSPCEKARLRAHLARLLHNPPTLRGVRRRVENLPQNKRRSLATFLLTLAGADGHLEGDEITVLEKIYDILGLDTSQVHQDLHSLKARTPGASKNGPVTVIDADKSTSYPIPHEEESTKPSDSADGVELDLNRVAAIRNETQDVARVLGDVFNDEDEEDLPGFTAGVLGDSHESFLVKISHQSEWPRATFDAHAESFGLIPGFAYEQINDVAFEETGEPLFEGDDPVEINSYALEALQS